ncbi:MAG: SDR family oxidoreductase [Promethearchaeota archaeon]
MFSLEEKVVIAIGAGLIGSEVVRGLAEAGARVIIGDIDEKIGAELETKLKKKNLEVFYKKINMSNEESVDNFFKFIIERYNKIDALVNMAWPKTEDYNNKEKLYDYETFTQSLKKHLGGYYLTSIKVAEIMKNQNYGSIINFSSIYGITAPDFSIYEGTNMTNKISYASNKGAINILTKYIATRYGENNVRANIIAPGGVFNNQPSKFVNSYNKKTPLKRMANPNDIVGPVIFLISNAASYITGHILLVDGGWSIW